MFAVFKLRKTNNEYDIVVFCAVAQRTQSSIDVIVDQSENSNSSTTVDSSENDDVISEKQTKNDIVTSAQRHHQTLTLSPSSAPTRPSLSSGDGTAMIASHRHPISPANYGNQHHQQVQKAAQPTWVNFRPQWRWYSHAA